MENIFRLCVCFWDFSDYVPVGTKFEEKNLEFN